MWHALAKKAARGGNDREILAGFEIAMFTMLTHEDFISYRHMASPLTSKADHEQAYNLARVRGKNRIVWNELS